LTLPGRPNVALWAPSLLALLLSGIASGTVLGAADGVAVGYVVGEPASPWGAGLWGAALGGAGGAVFVLVRRAFRGPDVSVEVGTLLGLLYGIAPGLAVVGQGVFVAHVLGAYRLAGAVMVCSMAGLLLGGLLDRITGAIVARCRRLQQTGPAEPAAPSDRPHG
jgi:hypothetical protein